MTSPDGHKFLSQSNHYHKLYIFICLLEIHLLLAVPMDSWDMEKQQEVQQLFHVMSCQLGLMCTLRANFITCACYRHTLQLSAGLFWTVV